MGRVLQLVEQQPARGRQVVPGRRRDGVGALLGGRRLPQRGLEEARVDDALQGLALEGVDPLLVREELQDEGDAEVRDRQVLQQQLHVAGLQVPLEVRQVLDVQDVVLRVDALLREVAGVAPARRRARLLHEPCAQTAPGARASLQGGGGVTPLPPQHSAPDSSPKAFPDPNTSANRISNRQ